MRKTYEKPEILFESFASSTNIAAGCYVQLNSPTSGSCAHKMDVGGGLLMDVFTEALEVCTIKDNDDGTKDGAYGGLCYHVPNEANSLFIS